MSQLICKNLTLGYDGKAILKNLSFSVNSGDYLCIVGENGTGKSTLMRTILRLQPPMEGTVETGDGVKRNEIGYLPQQTAIQKDFPASVREVVISGCLNRLGMRPFYNAAEKALAEENMRKMEVLDLAKRCFRELSGGQQQRVLLARALCATKKILLLDEPVAGLDMIVTQDMYSLIHKLNRDDGITMIMISHDIEAAVRYASHILHIGHPMFFGTKEEYLKSDKAVIWKNREGGDAQ